MFENAFTAKSYLYYQYQGIPKLLVYLGTNNTFKVACYTQPSYLDVQLYTYRYVTGCQEIQDLFCISIAYQLLSPDEQK